MRLIARRGVVSALVAAMLVGLTGCGGKVAAPPASLGETADIALPADIANLPLTEANGKTTTLAAYRGKAVMVADFLTLCTDVCPLISANTAAMARSLADQGQESKVALLEITVDPHRDDPQRLAAYQKLFGQAPPNWTLLTASPADLHKLWSFFGVYYRRTKEDRPPDTDWLTDKPLTYDVAHQDGVFFLNAAGHEVFAIDANPDVQGKPLPVPLKDTLSEQGRRLVRHANPVTEWTVAQGLSVFSWLLDTTLSAPA